MKKQVDGLKVVNYDGEGFFAPHSFGGWRIAYLNFAEKLTRCGMTYIERHNETDEVFVLLEGEATLLIGEELTEVVLQKNDSYIVEKGTWHNILMSKDAKVLLVENADTGRNNSDYMTIKF